MAVAPRALTVNDFHLFRNGGTGHVLVVPTSALFRIDDDGFRLLEALADQRKGPLDLDAFLAHPVHGPGGFDADEVDELLESLVQAGVLVGLDRVGTDPGIQKDALLRFTTPPVGTATALVSKDCNLKCGYCYADQGRFGDDEGGEMDFDTARRMMDLLVQNAGELPEITYQFLGGEPLLEAKLMRRIIEYGETEAAKIGKRIKFGLTTNGTFLTPEIVRYFLEHRVTVTVSLDGPKEINDQLRPNHGGQGTYDRVMRAARPLLKARPTRARVTVTKHYLDVEAITDHLLAEGFHEVGITPVNSTDPQYMLTDDDREEILRGFSRLVDRYVEAAKRGERFGFANLNELLKQVHEGRSQTHPCGAGISLFATGADGTIYPCHRFPGHKQYAMGHVDTGIDREKQKAWLAQVNVHNRSACRECWARYICSGGCYYLSAMEYGDVTQTFTPICDHLREWYEMGLAAYAELVESCPEHLDRIGLGGGA